MSNPVGRPTLLDDAIRSKIDEAAEIGCTLEEIALYIGVSRTTLYYWTKEDPELLNRIEMLRDRPVITARNTIVKSLKYNADNAFKYLEKKRKAEFGRSLDITTDGKSINSEAREKANNALAEFLNGQNKPDTTLGQ